MRSVRESFMTFSGIIVLALIGAGALHVAAAATWQEPAAIPPAGNPPGFVWTQDPNGAAQAGGQFNVAGGGRVGGLLQAVGMSAFGSTALDLGAATLGQNLLYGVASYAGMHPTGDALLLLQTADAGGMVTDRLRVDRDGNITVSGNVVTGNLQVQGCFGAILRSRSAGTFQGNAGAAPGGYVQANSRCPTGQHVCTTSEALNSITCGAFASAGVTSGTDMWISNLAPSLPTPTNDCIGWTTASPDWQGIKWRLDTTTGGAGYAQSCATALPFACCG